MRRTGITILLGAAFVSMACDSPTASVEPAGHINGSSLTAASYGRVVASVNGSWVDQGARTFAFTARQYDDGSVKGEWQRTNQPNPNHGDVVCLRIIDNQAWVGTVAETGALADREGGFRVVDNGQGRNAPPDQVSLQIVQFPPGGTAEGYCAAAPASPALFDVEAGNVTIR